MIHNLSGKTINFSCTERALPEFPEMLFGTPTDNGTTWFDATAYLQQKAPSTQVADFFKNYATQIALLQASYGVQDSDLYVITHEGHILIDGNFIYLFISFVEPDFLAYMCDRVQELFSTGFCVSDTYLYRACTARLSEEALKQIIDNEQNPKQP